MTQPPVRTPPSTLARPRRRTLLLSALGLAGGAGALALSGCGGGAVDEASVRFANGTVDYGSADFAVAGSKVVSALANAGATSNWVTIDAGDDQVALYAAGSSSAKLAETHGFATDSYTTVLAYGSLALGIKFRYVDESTAAPDSGVRLRLLQASSALGALDLYVTNATSLSGLSPTLTVGAYDALSGFVALGADSYRLRITASGDQSNVLYDLPARVALVSQSVITLAIVPRSTGSLPNVLALPEQSGAVLLPNSLAS